MLIKYHLSSTKSAVVGSKKKKKIVGENLLNVEANNIKIK
jgi:hypothetical protein